MALPREREKAIKLRLQGMSYTQIKNILGIGKGTLSVWLRDYPLSPLQLKKLVSKDAQVEKCRNTKAFKKSQRLIRLYNKAKEAITVVSARELFIAGFFLYWAEGWKTKDGNLCFTNTDPGMIRIYLKWLTLLHIPQNKIVVTLQLYADMDVKKQMEFWSEELSLPLKSFRTPSIKKSNSTNLTYKTGFGYGTCTIHIYDRDMCNYVLQAIKYLRDECNFVHLPGLEPGHLLGIS